MTGSVPPVSDPVAWHRAENLLYDADHDLWLDFTSGGGGAVLDLGCGIGRVAFPLARAGRSVVGLDSDAVLVEEFNRAGGTATAAALTGDVLELGDPDGPLGSEAFERIIAPQNLIQIIGGPDERRRFFSGIRSRLAPGGLAAITFIEDLPEVSLEVPPHPEIFESGGWTWSSLSVSLDADPDSITLHRLRQRIGPEGETITSEAGITFTRVTAETIEEELAHAGLGPVAFGEMPVSPDYIDSVIATFPMPATPAD